MKDRILFLSDVCYQNISWNIISDRTSPNTKANWPSYCPKENTIFMGPAMVKLWRLRTRKHSVWIHQRTPNLHNQMSPFKILALWAMSLSILSVILISNRNKACCMLDTVNDNYFKRLLKGWIKYRNNLNSVLRQSGIDFDLTSLDLLSSMMTCQ